MRIGICGSHWVWKTTLLDNIWHQNKIKEVARDLMKRLWNPKDMNKQDKAKFQCNLIYEQIKAELVKDNFLSDRTLIDVLAYTRWLKWYRELKKVVKEYFKEFPYDYIFYIPIEFELEDDWVRFTNNQKLIDDNIKFLLKDLKLDYITISWTVKERKRKIENYIL